MSFEGGGLFLFTVFSFSYQPLVVAAADLDFGAVTGLLDFFTAVSVFSGQAALVASLGAEVAAASYGSKRYLPWSGM
jgi:hypothetical protein